MNGTAPIPGCSHLTTRKKSDDVDFTRRCRQVRTGPYLDQLNKLLVSTLKYILKYVHCEESKLPQDRQCVFSKQSAGSHFKRQIHKSSHFFLTQALITKPRGNKLCFPDNRKTTAIGKAFCNRHGDFHLGGLFKEESSNTLTS